MPNVVNDHFLLSDFVHDQIVADWKAPEAGFARCLAHLGHLGDLGCHFFDASNKLRCSLPIIFRNVRKNLVEIREGAAFVPKLHALR